MGITSKDISVIIQGPVIGKQSDPIELQLTQKCILSIKTFLPDSEIILSTWEGTDVTNLQFDNIIFNKDPGGITYNDFELKNTFNNNNRQIVSTYNGLKIASRKYSIKIRGDFSFTSSDFIGWINKYNQRTKLSFFEGKIIVPTLGSLDPTKIPVLFAISDLFQIGWTKDLLNLWHIPLQPEPVTTRAFPYHKQFLNDPFKKYQFKMNYSSEQYIWYAFAKKKGLNIGLKYYCDVPILKIGPAVKSIISNFVILEPEQIGIELPTRLIHDQDKIYTNKKWELQYNNICLRGSKLFLLVQILKVFLTSLKFMLNNAKEVIKEIVFDRILRNNKKIAV